jgi:branched-chain amino acid aminotransferase
VFICDELFMTGTAAQITVATRVDYRTVGTGEMGPITSKMRELFADILHGKNPKYAHWNVAV